MSGFSLHKKGVIVPATADRERTYSLLVDGHRAWSFRLPPARSERPVRLAWPEALAARLDGVGNLTVIDAGSGETMVDATLRFGRSRAPIDLTDAAGRKLSVNKWGRLGVALEGGDDEFRGRLRDATLRVLTTLQEYGLTVFIIGGTLLGAVRTGKILDNDDDADLAYLSEHEHPADLVRENYAIERALVDAGYLVVRHSGAHLQVHVRADDGHTDFYVDLFTAFFRGGTFYEPIPIEAELDRSAIVPLGTVELEGVEFPAPADTNAWLTACYGENWRTPDPSFQFEIPERTLRKFDSWFGESLNLARTEWVATHQYTPEASSEPAPGARRFAERLSGESLIVDLGCGTGANARYFASLGHEVVGVDFAWTALERARKLADEANVSVEYRLGNLIDRRFALELAVDLRRRGKPVSVFAHHIADRLNGPGRETLFWLLRWLAPSGGEAWLRSYTLLPSGYSETVPQTWHLPVAEQTERAIEVGLVLSIERVESVTTPYGVRTAAETIVRAPRERSHE